MNKYKIIWSPEFKEELYNILDYLSFKLKEPITAKNFYKKVLNSLNTLKFFPEGYPIFCIKNKIYRKMFINKYVVIYKVNNNTRTSLYITYISL